MAITRAVGCSLSAGGAVLETYFGLKGMIGAATAIIAFYFIGLFQFQSHSKGKSKRKN